MIDESRSEFGTLLLWRPTIASDHPATHAPIVSLCIIPLTAQLLWRTLGKSGLLKFASTVPTRLFVLVGTKADLRNDAYTLEKLKAKVASLVDPALAEEKGAKLGAARVMECSAKNQADLKDVFDEVTRVGLAFQARSGEKKGSCTLL